MGASAEHEFVVLKKSYTYATCPTCNGFGIIKRTFRSMVYTNDCAECSGTGRIRFIKTEEVPLVKAIEELQSTVLK